MAEVTKDTEKADDFLATARKRFAAAAEDEKHLRDKFEDDLRFASPDGDDQWDADLKAQRKAAGRPALAFPRCHTFVQQVSNEARQNKPQIKFAPRLDSDKDTAEIYEGIARYIQYSSEAQVAYETAIEYSAGASFGYYRFLTDYVDDESDDLELKVVPVVDPLTIYGLLLPACFKRKAMFGFVVEDVPKEEYKQQYPDSELASLSWSEAEKRSDGWVGSETVRIAEYWWVTETKGKRRPVRKVRFCKINGMEILPDSETDWAGSTIPIIPVLGKQMIMGGKPRLFSVVRPQKAAQQLINYSKSRIAETLSTSPISPFMVAEGQIDGYESEWKTLNTSLKPFLTYKMVDVAGRPIPAPQRQTFEPPIQALSSFVLQEVDDMKATTGIFDASLGNQGNETSAKGIMARAQQSNLSTMHFMDNLERSFREGGDVIAEMIPKIYDTEREISILGEDEAQKIVKINQAYKDEGGKEHNYQIPDAKLKYVVTMGRAFSTQRMESFDMMQQVLQTSPNLLPMVGDIFFKNSDIAGADQLADRFKKMLPPNLQDDQQEPVPPQAQAQIQQLSQHGEALNAACKHYEGVIQSLEFEKKAKVVEQQGKMQQIAAQSQVDMALEDKKLLTQLAIAEAQTNAQNVQQRDETYADLLSQFHEQAHDIAMQAHAQAHQKVMQEAQAQAAQEAQAQGAEQQSQQMDQQHQQGMEAQAAQAEQQPESE